MIIFWVSLWPSSIRFYVLLDTGVDLGVAMLFGLLTAEIRRLRHSERRRADLGAATYLARCNTALILLVAYSRSSMRRCLSASISL